MKITVEKVVRSDIDTVWSAWNDPECIKRWNAASEDWHTTAATVDLRAGGAFCSRMEAKDGSAGFDFAGTYTRVDPQQRIDYEMDDGRRVTVEFAARPGGVLVREVFDAETTYTARQQQEGWQSILDNFARFVEAGGRATDGEP